VPTNHRPQPSLPPIPGDVDPPPPDRDVLARYQARVLEPQDAVRMDARTIRPTAYVAAELLIPADANISRLVSKAAENLGLGISDNIDQPPTGIQRGRGVQRLRLEPDRRAVKPDAWEVLETARALARQPGPDVQASSAGPGASDGLARVSLNHLVFATAGPIGMSEPHGGGVSPNALYQGGAISEYYVPGWGGRTSVAYVGRPPHRRNHGDLGSRRPVAVLIDTGCAEHPWLCDVDRVPMLGQTRIGFPGSGRGSGWEVTPDPVGPMDGTLPWAFGHGTFNCGLLRQTCPDADVLSVQAVAPDGVMDEKDLIDALEQVYELARRHVRGLPNGHPVDVLSLSLGYYPEELVDPLSQGAIATVLADLGRIGVVVVASAGNDGTRRQLFPAAFTPNPAGPNTAPERDRVPLVSVGARNPDRSIALFSNGGDWVHNWEVAVSVVSTMPVFNAGANPSAGMVDPSGQPRRSLDPDSFTGFATHSGTSYAAPVLAGRVLRRLIDNSSSHHELSLDLPDGKDALARGWRALEHVTKLRRPKSPSQP